MSISRTLLTRRYPGKATADDLAKYFSFCGYVETIRPANEEDGLTLEQMPFGWGGGSEGFLFKQEEDEVYFITDYGMGWILTPDTLILGYT